jgi:hypothetical protein
LMACHVAERDAGSRADRTGTGSLVGAWDAQLSLTNTYQLGPAQPTARMICGTIGFVDKPRGSFAISPSVEQIGVYDLDLSRLGLNWIADESYPEAIATSVREDGLRDNFGDSVRIVLNPGGSERIVLFGRYDSLGIQGDWQAQSLRGTATGRFSLQPHRFAAPSC